MQRYALPFHTTPVACTQICRFTGTIWSRRWIQLILECWSCSGGGSGHHTIDVDRITRKLEKSDVL